MNTKAWLHSAAVVVALLLLAGCAPKPVEFDLSVTVSFDNRSLEGAEVLLDGVVVGKTNQQGVFAQVAAKVPEVPVQLMVRSTDGKVATLPWATTFTLSPRKEGADKENQAFGVALQRYITVVAKRDGAPVAGATVSLDGKAVADTAADGSAQVAFYSWPNKGGLRLAAKKDGVGQSEISYKGESGDTVEMKLFDQAIVQFEAMEERNGVQMPIKSAQVYVGNSKVGMTDGNGTFSYRHKGEVGSEMPVRLVAPGYVPGAVTRQVMMGGMQTVRQFFTAVAPRQPRLAVVGFSSNTRAEDISDVVKTIEPKFVQTLFEEKAFKQVSTATAKKLIQRSKLSYEKLRKEGWMGTPLAESVDVLVFGSVARGEEDSYVVEASFYEPDGKLVMTQATVLSSSGSWRVGRAMSALVSNALASYPFTGVVTGVNGEAVQVNLGRAQFDLGRDDMFMHKTVKRDDEGRATGYVAGATYKVQRVGESQTEIHVEGKGAAPRLGDLVVRMDASGSSREAGADKVTFVVTGGKSGSDEPLQGANLYVDDRWVGSTDGKGVATVRLRMGREYDLIVYHHGYEQVRKSIEPSQKNDKFQFALKSFSSDLTIESDPSGAAVSLDEARIGTTPITKAYQVNLGFHTMRVDAGGGYRAWEEVVEFDKPEMDMTGSHKIYLYKDYLRAAEKAEAANQIDEAIRLYSAAQPEHPDYAVLRHRLGQLYLDDKHDADRAIAELERVQAIPEVESLVLKQYAVVYTNLGRAYYTKGQSMLKTKRNESLEYFAKAVKALDRARENTRFFPDERHEEAVHDTYYYRALSYHNLYQVSGREALRSVVENAWNEYLDFFPKKLSGNPEFEQMRESALSMSKQVQGD